MAKDEITKTIKGKYAGHCPDCNLLRGSWEIKGTNCGRCGHKFETKAVPLNIDGSVKEIEDVEMVKEVS